MKKSHKILATCLLLLLIAMVTHAQWAMSYQDPHAAFADAAFPTDDIGYVAATDSGGACILRTLDGGVSWQKRSIPGWSFVHKIAMIDSVSGYAMKGGAPVQIIYTTDGFQTFVMHNLDSSFVVEALSLINDSTGLYLNNGGRLRRFKQYGAGFIALPDTLFLGQNLQMVTPQAGYIDNNLGLLKTVDAGLHWVPANTNLGFAPLVFRFTDPLHGYFSDGNAIYKTVNGGGAFTQQIALPNIYHFANQGNLLCIAANDTGNVAVTIDGGNTWQLESTGINWIAPEPYKVAMTPGGYCFLYCGVCGEIRKRQDVLSALAPARPNGGITVSPNPCTEGCKITFATELDAVTVSVVDVLGHEVRQLQSSGRACMLPTAGLPAGIYVVQATQAGAPVGRVKIVVE